VASSIAAKSGRAMIEALTDGERRGPVLAGLAKGKMRAKIPDLSMALEGRSGDHHALMCRLHLDHIGHLEAMTARLDAQTEAVMAPFHAARDLASFALIGMTALRGGPRARRRHPGYQPVLA
jgi:transposase